MTSTNGLNGNYGLNAKVKPDHAGMFGEFGGKIGHPALAKAMQEIEDGFHEMIKDADFIQ